MASTHKHIRSSTANKRPTTAIADGQIALNTNSTSPGLFFKDSTGATVIKVGPVHVGTTAPNVSPASGGSSGNSTGEIWLDTSLTPNGVKIWNGSSWTNATPIGSTTVQGLLELATNAETQTGTDVDRAVTPAGLQSKVSDSTSTTSSTTIASSTAVKAAYDLADAALPKAGGTVTGNLEIGTTGSLTFEGATADGFETTLAVTDPTADRTITLPNVSGTVVTTGDTGTVTSTMIANGTIVDADVNASAAIAHSKLANITAGSVLLGNASNVPTATALSGDVTINSSGVTAIGSGVIVDADVSASAEIAVSKLADGTARQLLQTDAAGTGVEWTSNVDIPGTLDVTGAAVFDSTANIAGNLTVDTNTLFVDATNNRVGIGTTSPSTALHCVTNDGTFGVIRIQNSNASGYSAIETFNSSGTQVGAFGYANASAAVTSGNNYFYSSGNLTFLTGGTTERARIDTSGRLLVGTSTARSSAGVTGQFQVEGTSYNTSSISLINNVNSNQCSYLTFGKSRSGSLGGSTVVQSGDLLGYIQFAGADGTDLETVAAEITCNVDGTPGSNDMPGRLVFSTTADGASSPTERMRVDSSGRLLVGTSSADADTGVLQCDSAVSNKYTAIFRNSNITPYGIGIKYTAGSPNGSNQWFLFGTDSTTTRFYFRSDGGLGNYSANNVNLSDRNVKKDIAPAVGTWDCLKEWEIVNFRYKDQPDDADLHMGVIAQQVAESCPEVITVFQEATEDQPEKLGIKDQQMMWMAIKALQEAQLRIETLEAEVAALKAS